MKQYLLSIALTASLLTLAAVTYTRPISEPQMQQHLTDGSGPPPPGPIIVW